MDEVKTEQQLMAVKTITREQYRKLVKDAEFLRWLYSSDEIVKEYAESITVESITVADLDYSDIPLETMDDDGGIMVCMDLKHRLGTDETWVVIRTHSNKDAPPIVLGLFWEKENAVRFAKLKASE